MTTFAMLLIASALAFGLSRWWRTPVIPLLLLMGFILSGLGLFDDRSLLEQILEIGLTFLVFVAGIEMNPARIGGQRRAALTVGAVQFFLLGGLGLMTALILGYELQAAVYLGLAITASSTLVVVRLLKQRQQLFEPFGRLVIGVLLFQDLMMILLLTVVIHLWDGAGAVGQGLFGMAVLGVLTLVSMRWVVPWLVERYEEEGEVLLLSILAMLFVFVGIGVVLEVPAVGGAFLAGVALSPFPSSAASRGLLSSLSDFFLAFFFIALGGIVVISKPILLVHALVLSVVVIVITPLLVTLVAERAGLTARHAIEGGLLIAQASEFSLVVGLHGLLLGQISAETFSVIALVTVLTMVLTPTLSRDEFALYLMRFYRKGRRRSERFDHLRDHVVIIGGGSAGSLLAALLGEIGHTVIVVDRDPGIIAQMEERGVLALRAEISEKAVLDSLGLERASLVVSTTGRVSDVAPLREATPRPTPLVAYVFDEEQAVEVEGLGGRALVTSRVSAKNFIEWFKEHCP